MDPIPTLIHTWNPKSELASAVTVRGLREVTVPRYMPCYVRPSRCRRTAHKMSCMYGHTYSKGMDQPDKVANPASGQLNREN